MQTAVRLLLTLGLVAALCPVLQAQSELQTELKDVDVAPHWIYDDLPRALAEAKSSGKPLLVVLRCVPCPPGGKLDAEVRRPDAELERLEKQFVCVRIVKTQGLDLNLFQYDYDISWCAVFLNADKTVYGRFGTRVGRGPGSDVYMTSAAFRKALSRAWDLHQNYPGNKDLLQGKVGPEAAYRVPEEIPGLQDRANTATTKKNCIHCHMVQEKMARAKWLDGKLQPSDVWVYPMPDNIGFRIDAEDGLRVKAVETDSPAGKAGLAPGDELIALNGQPLISVADIQWVLHHVPDDTKLLATLRRDGTVVEKSIGLSGDWRQSNLEWRASTYGLRVGLQSAPLTLKEKEQAGIPAEDLALTVRQLYWYGNGAIGLKVLSKAGLKAGDVIVAVDGENPAMTESQFLAFLRLRYGPEDSVRLTVLRGQERLELTVPMW